MPRGKRRTHNYPNDEDRHVPPSKRLRTTTSANVTTAINTSASSAYTSLLHSHHQPPPSQPPAPPPQQQQQQLHHSTRRSRSEDSFSHKKCLAWFRQYTSFSEPDMLGPEGMERFCEDLEVEPENIVMLILAYKMGAANMGYFKQSEWLHGLTALQCDTIIKLKMKLPYLNGLLNDANAFKSIYRYAYDFAKDSDQRSMDVNTAKAMLELLLGKQWILHLQFAQFLEQSKYKVINKDQWCNILEFSRIINTDLTNYDIDGAWPVMLDEFVEWLRSRAENSSSAPEINNSSIGRHISS